MAEPLITASLYILLTLADGTEQHGYGIMKLVRELSEGDVHLGAATLYTNLKRLLEAGLIIETTTSHPRGSSERKRRYYIITKTGAQAVTDELARLNRVLGQAQRRFS